MPNPTTKKQFKITTSYVSHTQSLEGKIKGSHGTYTGKKIKKLEPHFNIVLKFIPLLTLTNKQIVIIKLLGNIIKPPTAIETRINMFPFLET